MQEQRTSCRTCFPRRLIARNPADQLYLPACFVPRGEVRSCLTLAFHLTCHQWAAITGAQGRTGTNAYCPEQASCTLQFQERSIKTKTSTTNCGRNPIQPRCSNIKSVRCSGVVPMAEKHVAPMNCWDDRLFIWSLVERLTECCYLQPICVGVLLELLTPCYVSLLSRIQPASSSSCLSIDFKQHVDQKATVW